MLLTLLLILLLVALVFGGYSGGRAEFGYWGWSPFGILLIVFVVLVLTGGLR